MSWFIAAGWFGSGWFSLVEVQDWIGRHQLSVGDLGLHRCFVQPYAGHLAAVTDIGAHRVFIKEQR